MADVVQQGSVLDETMKAAQEVARLKGDSFRIKIMRRVANGPPLTTAILDDAVLEHLSAPEVWMPALVGGGNYQLMAYQSNAESRGTTPVGSPIPVNIGGQAREPSHDVVKDPGWNGPRVMAFPAAPRASPPIGVTLNGAPGTPDRPVDLYPTLITRSQEELAAKQQQESYAKKERALAEEKVNFEKQQLMRQADARVKEVEDRGRDIQTRAEQDKRDLMTRLERIEAGKEGAFEKGLAVLGPAIISMIQASREEGTRLQIAQAEAAARMEVARAEAATRQMQIQMEAQQRADERMQTILMKMGEPKEDHLQGAYKAMIEGQTSMSNMMLGMVSAMVDMGMGGSKEPEVSPTVQIVNAISRGLAVLAKPKVVQQMAPPQFQGAPQQQPQRQLPQAPPAPEPQAEEQGEINVLEELVAMIDAKAPPAEVSQLIIDNAMDEGLGAALQDAGGDFAAVLTERLPEGWNDIKANREYLADIVGDFIPRAVQAGVLDENMLVEVAAIKQRIISGEEPKPEPVTVVEAAPVVAPAAPAKRKYTKRTPAAPVAVQPASEPAPKA